MQSATFELTNKIYRAGAGAGKTTQLVREVYEYFKFFNATYNKKPRIVITTFTRKATQELKERLMIEAQKREDHEFLNFVLSKNYLHISTIHGVLQNLLRQNAQIINLDPGFRITDDSEIFQRCKYITKNILEENNSYSDLIEEFTFKGLVTILIKDNQYRLLSDKLTYYSHESFQNCLDELTKDYILKLKSIGNEILDATKDEKWIEYALFLKNLDGHLQSIQNSLEQFKRPIVRSANPTIHEDLKERISELVLEIKKLDPELWDPKNWQKYIDVFEKFEGLAFKFSKLLTDWKKSSGLITMNDLELFSIELLKVAPEQMESFAQGYDYWLIDEYQDTSPTQVRIIDKLTKNKPHFVVGDPQQSIYFFRGARAEVFNNKQAEIMKSGIFSELNKNYRSEKSVMSFINYFFKNYAKSFKEMDLGGPDSSSDQSAFIASCENEEQQNVCIANHIISLTAKGESLSQICIISRKNDQLKNIGELLHKKGIPHILHSASGFQDRREILDALAILKFLVNPHDNYNLIQILRSPWFLVSDSVIYEIAQQKPTSYWSQFLKQQEVNPHNVITKLKSYLHLSYDMGTTQTFQKILVEVGMFDLSVHADSSGRRESNLWKLLVQLKSEDHKPGFQYLNFIDGKSKVIDLESTKEDADAVSATEPNRVQLMTVHMSKGLEFDHVIIPYIDKDAQLTNRLNYVFSEKENKFGLSLRLDGEVSKMCFPATMHVKNLSLEELAESDRLLYVAMTRAKKSLLLSTSGSKRSSNSWFSKIKIPLDLGLHQMGGFSYSVTDGSQNELEWKYSNDSLQKIPNKIFDLVKIEKKLKATSVTEQIKISSEKSLDLMEKALNGQRAHRAFEAMKYGLDQKDPVIQQAIQYMISLDEIPMERILKNGYAEWGFVSEETSGQIDLWAQIEDELWIIDYKTGSSRYSEIAIEQLSRYAAVLIQHTSILKVNLVAIYPFEQKFILQAHS